MKRRVSRPVGVIRAGRFLYFVAAALLLMALPGRASAASLVVDTLGDSASADGRCSLREAITAANSNADFNDCVGTSLPYGADTITFSVVGTIVLGSPLPFIAAVGGPLTIDGANHITVNGANLHEQFLVILGATLKLESLTATQGAGIHNLGTLTLNNTTVSENSNTTMFGGGGIANDGGSVTITNSTLSGNSATSDGGGIVNDSGGDVTIINSTLSGNSSNGAGGGVGSFGPGSTVTIINSTLVVNFGPSGGGIVSSLGSRVTITNSIVANNGARNCVDPGFIASGANLDTDGSCPGFTQVTSAQLNLGPLLPNGGPTDTHALVSGSSAIDAGTQSFCTAEGITNDQRGFARDTHCDVGSFEFDAGSPPSGGADLSIAQSAEKTAHTGRSLTYTIKVRNNGPSTATGIVVNDVLPPGTSFVSVGLAAPGLLNCTTPSPGSTGTVSCSFASLASASSLPDLSIIVQITAKGNAQLTNTATVTATEFDPNTANNSATATSKLGR